LDGSLSVWDAFAAAVPGSTFCHLSGWRAVMEDVLGHECFYAIACDDAGAWRGVLPLVRVRSALFGDYLVSLPFLNSGGPLGTPVLPRAFFTRLAAIFAGLIVFGAVYRSGQPVAAGCGFVWRDEFEMTWASSLREHSRSAPNMLLYWSFIEQMIARGVRVFD